MATILRIVIIICTGCIHCVPFTRVLPSLGADEKDKDAKVEEGESEPARADNDKDTKKEKDTSKKDDKKADKDKNKTADDTNKTASAKDDKPKIKVVKVPIKFRMTNLNVRDLEGAALEAAKQK